MAFDTDSIGVAKGNPGGYAWVGDTSATLPTDASTAIDTTVFTDLGYISEDGVTNATDQDTEDRTDWSGSVVKTTYGTFTETYQCTFWQSDETVLGVIYGTSNVTTDTSGNITVIHNGTQPEERAFIFESLISETIVMRTVIPRGILSERGDVTQSASDMLGFEATIKALPDSDGNTSYVYYYKAA